MIHHKQFGCKICKGMAKSKCLFCKFSPPRKVDDEKEFYLYQNWKNFIIYLRSTKARLIKFNMATTGAYDLDEKIKHFLGDWMTDGEREARIAADERSDKRAALAAK